MVKRRETTTNRMEGEGERNHEPECTNLHIVWVILESRRHGFQHLLEFAFLLQRVKFLNYISTGHYDFGKEIAQESFTIAGQKKAGGAHANAQESRRRSN